MNSPNAPLSRRLGFRLLAPLVLLVLVTGAGFAMVLLGLVRDFQHKLVQDDLTWTSRVVYKIIDDHYYALLRAGAADEPVQQRIQQGRAMDDLESFMRQKEFQAVLLGPGQGVLVDQGLAESLIRQAQSSPDLEVRQLVWQGHDYFTYSFRFEPWKWRILLLKRAGYFQTLQHQVHLMYAGSAGLVLLTALLIYLVQTTNIRRPLDNILRSLAGQTPPTYRGIMEFEFLSDQIATMMRSLEEREQFLGNILDSIQDGLVVTDTEGLILRTNPAVGRQFPDRVPAVGRPCAEMFPEFFAAAGILPSRPFDHRLLVLPGPGDESSQIELFSFPVRGPDREPTGGTIFYLRDITEKSRFEEILRRSEERFRTIFRISPDPIVLFHADRQTVLDLNQAFSTLAGTSRDQLIGYRMNELILWGETSATPSFLDRIRERGEVDNLEVQLLGNQSEPRTGLVSARTITLEEEPCVLLVLRDVTAEKEAERALRELDQVRSEFISTAAHELRTPLAAVMGYAEFLLEPELEGGLDAEQRREFLQVIYDKGGLLTKIVDELLDISRIERGGKLHLERSQERPAAIIQSLLQPFRIQFPRHLFRTALEEIEGITCLLDRSRLIQVMENLLSNAAKYSPKGSTVSVGGAIEGGDLHISVTDNGIGMTPEQIERIFDKFFRADQSLTAIGGLGLGMSIVRTIVEEHGGRIWVTSQPGQGTTVDFTLPLQPPDAAAPSVLTSPTPAGSAADDL